VVAGSATEEAGPASDVAHIRVPAEDYAPGLGPDEHEVDDLREVEDRQEATKAVQHDLAEDCVKRKRDEREEREPVRRLGHIRPVQATEDIEACADLSIEPRGHVVLRTAYLFDDVAEAFVLVHRVDDGRDDF
jgi:hypothetical protein